MFHSFSKIWISIILIVLFTGGILAWQRWWIPIEEVKSPEEEVKSPEGATEDETADWKTYTNEKYGYEIKYPPNCEVENIYGGKRTEILLGNWTKDSIFLEIEGYPDLDETPAREYYEKIFSPEEHATEAYYYSYRGKIKIAATDFEVYDRYLGSAEPNASTYVTLLNDTFFMININGEGQEEKALQVLNTIRFTDISKWSLYVTPEYGIRFPQEWHKEGDIYESVTYLIPPEYYKDIKDRYSKALKIEVSWAEFDTLLIDAIKNDLKKQGRDGVNFSKENIIIGGENGLKIKFFCDPKTECVGPQWFVIYNENLYHFDSGLGYSEIFDKIISTLLYSDTLYF